MAAPDPVIGTEVGRYRVVRLIGEGGMGRVYEGVNEIGNRVALKVLASWLAGDADVSERMAAEARAVNLIQHSRIVHAIDFFRLGDGRPVIVMELVEGRSLREFLGRDAPLGGIVDVILQVLDVLAAAHAVGVVHRDLKPDNVLISREGHARVLDFGIAKVVNPTAVPGPRTRTGVVLGTPLYMAPEQISGGAADPSVDLYALGIVLFEAVTGNVPFDGATDFDVMRAQVDTPPPSARARRPDLPIELERVIECALAKQPRERFASATAMANALRVAAQALPDQAWRSLTKSAPAPIRPTVPSRDEVLAALSNTAPIGRLEAPTARATVNERPPSRARWILIPIALVVAAAVTFVVIAIHKQADPPVVVAKTVAGDAHVVVPPDAAITVDGAPPDAAPKKIEHRDAPPQQEGVFAFHDVAGFEACLRVKSLVLTTSGQTRTLEPAEIQLRCSTAAVQLLERVKSADPIAYMEMIRRAGNRPAFALGLIELIVSRSRAACNDMRVYNGLADVIDGIPSGEGPEIEHLKAIIARCLKDAEFRKDFLEELTSHDKPMARRACEILTEQKLVTSCN